MLSKRFNFALCASSLTSNIVCTTWTARVYCPFKQQGHGNFSLFKRNCHFQLRPQRFRKTRDKVTKGAKTKKKLFLREWSYFQFDNVFATVMFSMRG